MENQKALKKVSDKDLRKVFLHSLAIMCSWNYAVSYTHLTLPTICSV